MELISVALTYITCSLSRNPNCCSLNWSIICNLKIIQNAPATDATTKYLLIFIIIVLSSIIIMHFYLKISLSKNIPLIFLADVFEQAQTGNTITNFIKWWTKNSNPSLIRYRKRQGPPPTPLLVGMPILAE